MSDPVLLAVAHGSRDPAARQAVLALAGQVSALAPGIDVRVAFLQHAEPSLAAALRGAGRPVVIVPLLLSAGYHLSADIAMAASAAGARVAAPLGPDPLLAAALADRLAQAGAPAGVPVVLAAAGSADPAAAADVRRQAEQLAAARGAPVTAAFVTSARPAVGAAITAVSTSAGVPVAAAAYLLAPGRFHDRLRHAASGHARAPWVSAPLGSHPAVAALVAARYLQSAVTA